MGSARADGQVSPPELVAKRQSASCTPVNLFDRVIAATAAAPEKDDEGLQRKVDVLRGEMKRRIEGLGKVKMTR
jgi:hypothetical protein